MNKLEAVDRSALRAALAETSDSKAVKRLMVALAYRDGISVKTLSERYGVPRSTVYSWLDRFETDSIADAIQNEHRPGRPAQLDEQERAQLTSALRSKATEFGFSEELWTPESVREYIQQELEVSYSLGHIRRLIRRLDK